MLDFLTLIPPKYRRWIYPTLALVGLVVSAWRASDGHWDEALYIFLTSVAPLTMAGKNVQTPPPGDGTSRDSGAGTY